jgi:hypothetical protein
MSSRGNNRSGNRAAANANAAAVNLVNAAANAVNAVLPSSPSLAPALPVSGSEDVFTDVTYGSRRGKGNNNCYGWAVNEYRNSGNTKLQPGNLSRRADNNAAGANSLESCKAIVDRAVDDLRTRNKGGMRVAAEVPCPRGQYKVMAFLAPREDFHWYKQHKDLLVTWPKAARSVADLARVLGVSPRQIYAPQTPKPGDRVLVRDARAWSHKQGFATGPLLKDACGRSIKDPRKACRTYSRELDYSEYCGALCVKKS